jgi:hypothetical protein
MTLFGLALHIVCDCICPFVTQYNIWTIVDGAERGRATAITKTAAREEAARVVLQVLGIYDGN